MRGGFFGKVESIKAPERCFSRGSRDSKQNPMGAVPSTRRPKGSRDHSKQSWELSTGIKKKSKKEVGNLYKKNL